MKTLPGYGYGNVIIYKEAKLADKVMQTRIKFRKSES